MDLDTVVEVVCPPYELRVREDGIDSLQEAEPPVVAEEDQREDNKIATGQKVRRYHRPRHTIVAPGDTVMGVDEKFEEFDRQTHWH